MSKFFRTIILTTIALIIIPHFVHAGWMRTYGGPSGDVGFWIEITDDSGYMVCGASLVEKEISGITALGFLLKTNLEGDSLWMRHYNVSYLLGCQFYSLQQTADKGYVLTGYGTGYGPFPNVAIMKTDPEGDSLWAHRYGVDTVESRGRFVRQTTDGGYIIAGETGHPGERDIWVLRADSLGDTLWTRTFGGVGSDNSTCVRQTSDGNFVVVGTDRTVAGDSKVWLLKLDDEGSLVWERKYGGETQGWCVQETADSGLIITGSSHGGGRVYLLKTDSAGDSLWTRRYSGNFECRGYSVEQTTDGGYVIAGVTSFGTFPSRANGWLIKTDSLGDTLWTRTLILTPGGDNSLYCVHQTLDGGYIIAGMTGENVPPKGFEAWLIKTDSLGYVGIAEIDNPPVVETASTVDTHVTLHYDNYPNGFHAYVYDASGQKVGELHNASTSGAIEWGQGQQAGVYFIRELSGSNPTTRKVVLVR